MQQPTDNPILWTALVTPLLNGVLDFPSLTRLLSLQEQHQNGLLLLGSTGEAFALTLAEKKAVLSHAFEKASKTPLMIGAGGMQMDEICDWISYCDARVKEEGNLNFYGYLCPVPLYSKPGPLGQYDWFQRILDHAQHPIMLYNNPSRTGMDLSVEALHKLSCHPNLWGLKDSSGSPDQFAAYQEAAPNIVHYAGDDNMVKSLAPLGAHGLISVMANAWPRATKAYVLDCFNTPAPTFNIWGALAGASNPIPIKALLAHLKIISSAAVRPPLNAQDLKDVAGLAAANEEIKTWHQKEGSASDGS